MFTGRCCSLIQNLDGLEFTLFVLWSIVVFLGIGFATDYVFSHKGMGPYWNAGYAMLGCYLGGSARTIGGFGPFLPMSRN